MNRTTGLDATALSITALVFVDNSRNFPKFERINGGLQRGVIVVLPDQGDARRKA